MKLRYLFSLSCAVLAALLFDTADAQSTRIFGGSRGGGGGVGFGLGFVTGLLAS